MFGKTSTCSEPFEVLVFGTSGVQAFKCLNTQIVQNQLEKMTIWKLQKKFPFQHHCQHLDLRAATLYNLTTHM